MADYMAWPENTGAGVAAEVWHVRHASTENMRTASVAAAIIGGDEPAAGQTLKDSTSAGLASGVPTTRLARRAAGPDDRAARRAGGGSPQDRGRAARSRRESSRRSGAALSRSAPRSTAGDAGGCPIPQPLNLLPDLAGEATSARLFGQPRGRASCGRTLPSVARQHRGAPRQGAAYEGPPFGPDGERPEEFHPMGVGAVRPAAVRRLPGDARRGRRLARGQRGRAWGSDALAGRASACSRLHESLSASKPRRRG